MSAEELSGRPGSADGEIAYIGLGSNLGDRVGSMARALRELSRDPGVRIDRVSSVYETEPVGVPDQPRFLNAAARLETRLGPRGLLDLLLDVERRLGRIRILRWGPRTIDLDLLLHGDSVVHEEGLAVPHPLLAERFFVLAPLCELDGLRLHPVLKRPLQDLYRDLKLDAPLRPAGPLRWRE